MPTVFARLDASMSGNDVSARVTTQVGNLNAIADGVRSLIENPPNDVSDLFRVAGSIQLPELQVAADLSSKLIEMRGSIPTDPSVVLSGLLGSLGKLHTDFGGAIGAQLGTALLAIERIHALTRIDLRCVGGEGEGEGEGESGGGGGGGGGGGAVVRPGAENWLVELHELRELLEPAAAARAAERITDSDLVELDRLAEQSRPHSRSDWQAAAQQFDFALHLTIAKHSGNFALGETIRKIWAFKRISYMAIPEPAETIEKGHGEHLALVEALRARDSETARAAMLYHLRSVAAHRTSKTIV